MEPARQAAAAEFRRILRWIVVVAVVTVAAALAFLASQDELTVAMIVATVLGVFFSVLLGCGLFAAAFFGSKSGHDQTVADFRRSKDDHSER